MKKVLMVILILLSTQLFAQDSTKKFTLGEVVVTSVRADKKTPVTQKTIGDTTIQETYQGQEIPMILGSLPAMYSNSDGGHAQGYSYFTLRGASQNRINMTLNGVPLNEPEDHGVYTSNYPSFINSIQSLQIQRGVGTSSNGAASFIGSINFQSKSGLREGTEIQLGGGSYNTFRANASSSSGLSKNKYAYFVNAGMITTDGFRENSGSNGGSIFFSGGYYGEKRTTKLIVFTGMSKNKMAWDGSDENVLKNNFRDNPRGNDNMDLFVQTHIQLHNINTFNSSSKLTTTLFYNHLEGHYDVYNKKDLPIIGYYASERQHSNWVGYVGQYDYKTEFLNLTFGASLNTYMRNHGGVEYYSLVDSLNYQNAGIKNEISGFAKVNFGDNEVRYYVDIQARYVDFKYKGNVDLGKQNWLFINPKFGAKLFLSKSLDVYTMVGISHREPTRSVMFNNGLYLSNFNNIKPEEVVDIESGVNLNTKKLKLQANIFMMSFKNEIIAAGPIGSNSLPMMINVDKSIRFGFEIDADVVLSDYFMYSINSTLSDNQYGNKSKRQLFSPNVMLNHSLTYTNGSISVNLNHSYFSSCYIDIENQYTVPAYHVLGANVSYGFKNYKLTLQGNNLTGEKYYCNGYATGGTRYLFPNALANYYATLRVTL